MKRFQILIRFLLDYLTVFLVGSNIYLCVCVCVCVCVCGWVGVGVYVWVGVGGCLCMWVGVGGCLCRVGVGVGVCTVRGCVCMCVSVHTCVYKPLQSSVTYCDPSPSPTCSLFSEHGCCLLYMCGCRGSTTGKIPL